jgi:hypothetical protein
VTAPTTTDSMTALAARVYAEAKAEMGFNQRSDWPAEVMAAAADDADALTDRIGAVRQLAADLADLNSKRDLLPGPGWQRLRTEALEEARRRSEDAAHRSKRAQQALAEALTTAALPKLDKSREALARQELALLLGTGNPHHNVLRIAQRGSRDATAVLVSTSFGESLLESRGLQGRELKDALTNTRTIVSRSAAQRPEATPDEIRASAALNKLPKLAAAVATASIPSTLI